MCFILWRPSVLLGREINSFWLCHHNLRFNMPAVEAQVKNTSANRLITYHNCLIKISVFFIKLSEILPFLWKLLEKLTNDSLNLLKPGFRNNWSAGHALRACSYEPGLLSRGEGGGGGGSPSKLICVLFYKKCYVKNYCFAQCQGSRHA
jgi:hypothetical protein